MLAEPRNHHAESCKGVLEPFLAKGPGFCLYFPARTQEQPKLRALIEMATSLRGTTAKRESKKR